MTPFSTQLIALRTARGVRQKALALDLKVGPSYVSALENGRKQPPKSERFYAELRRVLKLTDEELDSLRDAAFMTAELGSFAVGSSHAQIRLAVKFANCLRHLGNHQIAIIDAVLNVKAEQFESAVQ